MINIGPCLKSFLPFKNLQKKGGFTLLEMIISTGIFTAVVVAAISITISISNAQLKIAAVQAILDNIRFGLELISKEMRTGANYELTTICAPAGSEISFNAADGTFPTRMYFLNNEGKIMRSKVNITAGDCADPAKVIPLSADEVLVEFLNFDLSGNAPGSSDGQPMVTISIRVSSREPKFGPQTNMNLQTSIVQRLRDSSF